MTSLDEKSMTSRCVTEIHATCVSQDAGVAVSVFLIGVAFPTIGRMISVRVVITFGSIHMLGLWVWQL